MASLERQSTVDILRLISAMHSLTFKYSYKGETAIHVQKELFRSKS
jgi:hypothetical protein